MVLVRIEEDAIWIHRFEEDKKGYWRKEICRINILFAI